MDKTKVIALIEALIKELVKEQKEHLERGMVERTFTADFRDKLLPHFQTDTISVDCFYNKHLNAAKRLQDKIIELDIAIHERGIDEQNLVAIEIETNNNPKRDDIWKLKAITQDLEGFEYILGLYLAVGTNNKAGKILAIEWYEKGERIK